MKKFGRIYLISYALIFSVMTALLVSTYTLLPSKLGRSDDDTSNAVCFQDGKDKFGLTVTCQPPAPEFMGSVWTVSNQAFISTTFSPLFGFTQVLSTERSSNSLEDIIKMVGRSFLFFSYGLLGVSPHLLALILVIRRIKARVRGPHSQRA